MRCAECETLKCLECDNELTPKRGQYIRRYKEDNGGIVENSYKVTSETKGKASRVDELVLFSKNQGYKKIGIAFCKALVNPARKLNETLKSAGFETVSVCCKICEINKKDIAAPNINPDASEVACNPYAQADALNKENPDLTVTVGFCMGHDILFYKNIKTPVSPLIVKDRAHGHNPIEALK